MTTLERWDEATRLLRKEWAQGGPIFPRDREPTYWSVARELIPLGLRTPHETAYGGAR